MKDLAWATAVAIVAALCGWLWQVNRSAPPPPASIGSGEAIGAAGSGARFGPYKPNDPAGSAGSRGRGTRGTSDHEQVTAARPRRVSRSDGGFVVNFPYLASFRPLIQDESSKDPKVVPAPIPPEVRELDGKTVEVQGFMIALHVERQRAVQFLLSRYSYDQCCFGTTPLPNEWIVVDMDFDHAITPVTEGTVTVEGHFSVGAEHNEQGELVSLYRLKGTRIERVR